MSTVYFVAMTALSLVFYIPVNLLTRKFGKRNLVLAAFPMAIFGILPQAMVADISESDSKKTGENREGMFYAARTFAFKLGQSVSMLLFTALATLGSAGDGYRIVAGTSCALALIGGVILLFYNEKKINKLLCM